MRPAAHKLCPHVVIALGHVPCPTARALLLSGGNMPIPASRLSRQQAQEHVKKYLYLTTVYARNSAAVKVVTKASQWYKIGTRGRRKKGRGALNPRAH
ncbi:hypothetical protein EVAR_77143_1 [Eumeta japonica]|uniref:Uncharacterized protein n=1 Tax=Eumeta variegata TaxID=151549 RepID=A0A4C1T1P5_EUMVA|nr:hypothetical protein EVAR_77143_1 [Eumeta japonica]